MSDKELRLRLFVRRHGLPETKLLWTVPADPDWTIAKLLTQVNEAVPLESGEWGLEDYAVELKAADGTSFECLHFQQVSRILKDDDQVMYAGHSYAIRPRDLLRPAVAYKEHWAWSC